MNLDLHKIKSITFVTILFIILSTICSGILFIFIYSRELFMETDTFKLLLLSFAITSPFWIINSCVMATFDNDRNKLNPSEDFQIYSMSGSIISIPVIYIPIIIKIFKNVTLQVGVLSATSIELLILIILFMSVLKNKS